MKTRNEIKNRGKGKMLGLIIALIFFVILGVGGAIGWSYLSRESKEARNLSLNAVDFSKLNDGTYIGDYEGGMYKWRVNKAQVTVASGKVRDIRLLTKVPDCRDIDHASLYDRVIKAQSLEVDTISGATLTSKAILKSVENALVKAQKK